VTRPAPAGAEPVVPAFEMVVGLEVHVELLTATKLFCGCPNAFGDTPNRHVCPVCLGLPGALPVLNEKAVEIAVRVGLALEADVRPSVFARKNYFYPDMPKGYQISQYEEPICVGGRVPLPDGSVVRLVRAHLEEDTGKSTHVGGDGRIRGADHSLVDFNRAGVPLLEIVSQPDIRSVEQARAYVSELRAILVAIGASDGRMEEGSLRVDANVSIRPVGSDALGTRCEIKNLNSLRSLGRALDAEVRRQSGLLAAGEVVRQETRHFDEAAGTTVALRSKEDAHDYRYFPDPDLVPVVPSAELLRRARAELPALPAARRAAVVGAVGDRAPLEQVVTVVELGLDELVCRAVERSGVDGRLALARAANELARRPEEARRLDPEAFGRVVELEAGGELGASQAKTLLAALLERGGDPDALVAELGLGRLSTGQLRRLVTDLAAAHPAEWARFVAGDSKVGGFLVGQVMKATEGRADGKAIREALEAARAGDAGLAGRGAGDLTTGP